MQQTNQVLIGGEWIPAKSVGVLSAYDPRTGMSLEGAYPTSGWEDCEAVLNAATAAADVLEQIPGSQIASFLEAYAQRLQDAAEKICAQAEQETALPQHPRLMKVELPRTVSQLRQAAECARSGSWREPVEDPANSLFTCAGPLGPALIFGPNNFPLAFNSVAGGDFAAAIAAGNPVLAKAHPSHPGTSRILAEEANVAAHDTDLPNGTVQLLYNVSQQDGLRLTEDPRVSVIAFTGSRQSGMALKASADRLGKPIYLEMSSVNPVFFLPGAIAERGEELAAALAESCLLGVGQFCTCPNLSVLAADANAEQFIELVRRKMELHPEGVLLARSVAESLASSVDRLTAAGASVVTGGKRSGASDHRFENTLLRVSGAQFLRNPNELQTEAFGPATLVVVAGDTDEAVRIARCIEGSLTASVYSANDGRDDESAAQLMRILRRRAGRLLNDRMPTGVAVSPAMNHGGPFPATGHPGFTAVGLPAAIRRFTKLDCYDHVRPERLPSCFSKQTKEMQ